MKLSRLLLIAVCCTLVFGTDAQNLSGSNSSSKYHTVNAFSATDVKLKQSWLSERENRNKIYLYSLDPERLLHNFRVNAGIPSTAKPLDGWEHPSVGLRGHFVGHFLSACASQIKNDGDTLLANRINYMVNALAECQQKMGGKYLSAFPENDFSTLEKQYTGVWAPYYTYHKVMQGLLDVYILTGNPKAYQIVLNMADYVQTRMDKLSAETIEKMLYTPAANPSNEAGAMNEVLHNLYAVSHNPKHLKLAEIFDRKWFSQPLTNGIDILSGLHANTHLVLVNGFAKRYENTHETSYRDAAVNFWDMLEQHHCYVNGSSSGPRPIPTTPTAMKAEHWGRSDGLSTTLTDEISESCVTHNTQKLTSTLFRWTANPSYADVYMNTFYNGVLPTQNSENGAVVYHLPLSSPRQKKFLTETDFRCCNGTGIEAFTHLNANIYFHDEDNLWVNMFIPTELNWNAKKLKIEQITNFPQEPKTTLIVRCGQPTSMGLKLFIPSWADNSTKVLLNGKPLSVSPKPNSFLTINHIWNNNDKVEIIFNFSFRVAPMNDNKNVIALYYGPVLLAFETNDELILKGTAKEIAQSMQKSGSDFTLLNNGKNYKLKSFYSVNSGSYGVYATIRNEY
ncbi:MAG: glycoside hydrolase family 127 protein [Paludibacter sp.]|nr:glycoside hydrolase family 127 protein [Paludibacter sp.]